jgi:UDP-galactopyranose mutase
MRRKSYRQAHHRTTRLWHNCAIEYPLAYRREQNLPYYPVPREENRKRYNLYLSEAESLNHRVLFAGRLADYKYYNMDQAVARALGVFEKQVAKGKGL